MMFKSVTIATAMATLAIAQRPSNTSICDYYTTALLKNNTAANQETLLTLIVNTAVIGNYTTPNVGISVPGILAPGEFNGTAVNLLPYFDGGFASTNVNNMSASKNFLDGGGADPLKLNKPATDNTSLQYILLTHLYSYFGGLLGCTMMGTDFPVYDGTSSMYEVHKFMDLSSAEVGYFISQVAASAASFGVATDDLTVVGTALNTLFNRDCSPPTVVIPSQPAALQAICIGTDCKLSDNATCSDYDNNAKEEKPSIAVSSLVPTSSVSVTGTATGLAAASSAESSASKSASSASKAATASTKASTGGASAPTGMVGRGMEAAAVAAGFAALLL